MQNSLRDYINEVMNDNRIFSHEDVIAMDNEEGKYYQKALDYQYGKIGFPRNSELASSDDVVFVQEYTRQDGTVVRAHYRSKAGHGNPNKPVMKSPQEYKSELEKEINDYMDRDVQKRYGMPTGFAADANLKTEKLVKNESKEKNGGNIKEDVLRSPDGYKFQAIAAKTGIGAGSYAQKYPTAVRYYKYALQGCRNVDEGTTVARVNDIKNQNIKQHIKQINNKITDDCIIISPDRESSLVKSVKQNHALIRLLVENKEQIKNGMLIGKTIPDLKFYNSDPDLGALIGEAHIFSPYIDTNGDLYFQIPDFYDFEYRTGDDLLTVFNNNAYIQQEKGMLTNYVLLINVKYTKEELTKIPGWK